MAFSCNNIWSLHAPYAPHLVNNNLCLLYNYVHWFLEVVILVFVR